MKKNMTMLLTICLISLLHSCRSPQIKPLILHSVKWEYNSCAKRCYDLNTMKEIDESNCGPNFKKGNYDIAECDKISGFKNVDIANPIIPWAKEVKQFYEDMEDAKRVWWCKKKKRK